MARNRQQVGMMTTGIVSTTDFGLFLLLLDVKLRPAAFTRSYFPNGKHRPHLPTVKRCLFLRKNEIKSVLIPGSDNRSRIRFGGEGHGIKIAL